LRIGWLIGPEKIIEKAWKYHDYTSISTSVLSQYIATRVLKPENRIRIFERNRKILNDNLLIIKDWIKSHEDLFYFISPQAGGMAYLKYNLELNSRDLATKLRQQKSVFVMDGECFGMDNYIRIGIGSEKNKLIKGLQLIDEFLNEL
jgi:aspartate/methionine/tyrosine aminotransferase